MSRKDETDDTVSYLLRDIPGDDWRAFKVRAIIEQKSLRDALLEVIREYGEGEPIEPKGKRRK